MAQTPSIDLLLNLVPDAPDAVLTQLRSHPDLASKQDAHGYSLLHAAISYGHLQLMKALVKDFHVDPNLLDEDEETCLFNAETVEMAKEALELGVNMDAKNSEGQTAADKLDDEDEQPLVAAFLRETSQRSSTGGSASAGGETGGPNGVPALQSESASLDDEARHPPPLPAGVQLHLGTMNDGEAGDAPDPEFRRRIEELAARSDFNSEETQRELRNLVSDAVSGITEEEGQGPATRRRLG